jgi:tight adherence protein B
VRLLGARQTHRVVLVVLVVAGLLMPSAVANAEAKGRILQVLSKNGKVEVLFGGVGLPNDAVADPASAKVTIDGATVLSQARALTDGETLDVQRTAVIAIDTSGSMAGARLAAAKSAAGTFLDSLPADVRVGLVTFSSRARVDVKPTLDRTRIRRVVRGLAATGNTALYDAAALSVRTAGSTGARTVLLLSDGQDDGSRTSLASAITIVQHSRVLLSAVALGAEATAAAPLAHIAAAAGGTVLKAANAADLASAFRTAAKSIGQQVLVTATLPEGFSKTSGTVTVQVTFGSATLSDFAFTTLSPQQSASDTTPDGAKPVDVGNGALSKSSTLYASLAALFLGLVGLLGMSALAASRREGQGVRRRLSIYTLTGRKPTKVVETSALGDSVVARSAVDFAGRVVSQGDFESRVARKLEAGGVPLKPAEWLLLHVGASVGLALLFFLLGGADVVAALIGLLIGALVPFGYLVVKEARRTSAFLAQLPDTLQLVAGSLTAGYSLPQSLDSVVREGSQPMSTEFGRALVESRLGVPIEDCLDGIAERMDSKDFAWVVMAIRIQREVGGNLAELLTTVSGTLRERERLRRQVQVLSAEGRLSAYILGGLPPLFGLYLVLVRRSYISPLFNDPIGVFLLITMGVLMVVGAFWLRKVVTVEV